MKVSKKHFKTSVSYFGLNNYESNNFQNYARNYVFWLGDAMLAFYSNENFSRLIGKIFIDWNHFVHPEDGRRRQTAISLFIYSLHLLSGSLVFLGVNAK